VSLLVRDEYAAYDSVDKAAPGRMAAGCLAHARRKFEELLINTGKSAVAAQALEQIGAIYRIEREIPAPGCATCWIGCPRI